MIQFMFHSRTFRRYRLVMSIHFVACHYVVGTLFACHFITRHFVANCLDAGTPCRQLFCRWSTKRTAEFARARRGCDGLSTNVTYTSYIHSFLALYMYVYKTQIYNYELYALAFTSGLLIAIVLNYMHSYIHSFLLKYLCTNEYTFLYTFVFMFNNIMLVVQVLVYNYKSNKSVTDSLSLYTLFVCKSIHHYDIIIIIRSNKDCKG